MQWWIYDMSLGIFAVAFRRGLLVNHNLATNEVLAKKSRGSNNWLKQRDCQEDPLKLFIVPPHLPWKSSKSLLQPLGWCCWGHSAPEPKESRLHRFIDFNPSHYLAWHHLKYTDTLLKIGELQWFLSSCSFMASKFASFAVMSSASNMVCSEYAEENTVEANSTCW